MCAADCTACCAISGVATLWDPWGDWRFEFAEKLEDATTKSCTELAHAVILPTSSGRTYACTILRGTHEMMELCERVFRDDVRAHARH